MVRDCRRAVVAQGLLRKWMRRRLETPPDWCDRWRSGRRWWLTCSLVCTPAPRGCDTALMGQLMDKSAPNTLCRGREAQLRTLELAAWRKTLVNRRLVLSASGG